MIRPMLSRLLLAAVPLLAGAAFAADDTKFEPYVIDHMARAGSPVDVSFLLGKDPAGKDGYITLSKDGHLVKPDGSRFRIWGVNLTGWTRGGTLLPPKDQAEAWAKALARVGVNCVRMHFLDLRSRDMSKAAEDERLRKEAEAVGQRFRVRPNGIIDHRRDDNLGFDADAVDRLDYFIYQLKRHGIYTNLNLNVGMRYLPGDGVPDADVINLSKGFTYIGERMLEVQRHYARQLLTHHNPYTNTEYRHEPAIATVEIVNENSILEFWMRNWLRGELVAGGPRVQLDFTPRYAQQLDGLYQDWLKAHRKPAELARLRELAGVKPGEAVPRLRRGSFSIAPTEQFQAEAEFLTDVEKKYFRDFGDFLKKELGVKALVIGNADHTYWIPGQPLLRSNSILDFTDGHVYWQHPAIWGRRNTPMVDEPLRSTILKLSRAAMTGRAYTVSEVNHPNPNEYGAEMIPILAAYAALQDWDGIYFYTFETKIPGEFQHYVADEFDITFDPVKMSQMPVGALIFSRADVRAAKKLVSRSYSAEQVNETMRMPEAERPFFTPGMPKSLPLRHGSRIESVEGKPTGKFDPEVGPPYLSDTGELAWHLEPGKHGLVTIDSPRTQALVGFIRENATKTTKHLHAELKTEFAVITLSSLTEEPVQRANRLLLTACARWQNSGAKWNDRRTLWTDMGRDPTLIEPVEGWLMLREIDGAVGMKVTPLDGSEKPIGNPIDARRLEDGWEIPLGNPATTHYLIEVIR